MSQQSQPFSFRERVALTRARLAQWLSSFRPGPRVYATAFCVGATIGEYAALGGEPTPQAILAAISALGAQLGVNLLADIIGPREPPRGLTVEEIAQGVQERLERGEDLPAVRVLLHEFRTLNLALETWRWIEDERLRQLVDELSTHPQLVAEQVTTSVASALDPRFTSLEKRLELILDMLETIPPVFLKIGTAPPLPTLLVGREGDIQALKTRLGKREQALIIVHGWPGVGKTTLASALAHDSDIAAAFPDGVLWSSLGQQPNLLARLAMWLRALGIDDTAQDFTLEDASAQLRVLLADKRILLIVDDIWETEQAFPFRVGGLGCATLITTRDNDVAQRLAVTPDDIYRLPLLTDEKALELLRELAKTVVEQHPEECLELARDLQGLPLALQVAGRLLDSEASFGWGVANLLAELREGTKLLESQAPADLTDIADKTTPTVAALLQKSTDRLDPLTRYRFAFLGALAPKPATFDLEAMAAVWRVDDPKPTVRRLVDRGLLEPIGGRFQMHSLLVMLARSLLTD